MIDWSLLTNQSWSIDGLIDGWIDGWMCWLIDWLIKWLVDWLFGWLVGWLVCWSFGRLIDWSFDQVYQSARTNYLPARNLIRIWNEIVRFVESWSLTCEQAHLFGASREYLRGGKASRRSRREEWGEEKWACTWAIDFWILRVRPRTQRSDWLKMTGYIIAHFDKEW